MRFLDRSIVLAFGHDVPGAGRIARVAYGGRPGHSVATRLNGMCWEADPLDWMDQQVLRRGTYEPEISDLLVKLCGPAGVLWDVGAHAGIHSVTVAKREPGVVVVAFEPTPVVYSRFRRNIALNDVAIEAYCIALADSRGYRDFSVVEIGNSGHNSLAPWPDVTYTQTIPVWCDTGDDLLAAGVPQPTVLKADVEGAEGTVFAGMPQVLANPSLRHIVFESSERSVAHELLRNHAFAIDRLRSTGGGVDWLASR